MKNKIELKKTIIISTITFISILLIILSLKIKEYKIYRENYNKKIESITTYIIKEYPNITEEELIKIINSNINNNTLKQYGIDIKKDDITKNKENFITYTIKEIIIIILLYLTIIYIYLRYNNKKDKQIKDITQLINEINKNNYKIQIDDLTEDELSILKQEIYKTTIMLREQAENSTKDKKEIKKSIEDISHQLKTPLTSILINIDNITENPKMGEKTKEKFLKEIKRETYNIKTLVETLLKLSKFDVNSVEFINKEIKISKLIEEALNKTEVIADLKNIKINIENNTNETMICDLKWQTEAISNIIKNAIEHSKENSIIDIKLESNKIYNEISITNYDAYIDEEDQKHLFERFYKAKNSKEESVGIGLALSKSIIEKNNGKINVSSNKEKTTFTIKYSKY